MCRLIAALWLGLAGFAATSAWAAPPLRAGLGVAPLPTPENGPLGGYGGLWDRRAEGVHDTPEARALLLEGSGLRVALVTLDVVIARPEIRAELQQRADELDLDVLLLAATHTHSGPGGYIEGFLAERITAGHFDARAREGLVAAAASALARAETDLHAVAPAAHEVKLERAENRRDPTGENETSLPVLALRASGSDDPLIVIFAFGAHPTVWSSSSRVYSADYPGAARAGLERRGIRALFLPGPMGDQRPRSTLGELGSGDPELEEQQVQEIGDALARATERALESLDPGPSTLAAVERELELPDFSIRRFCGLWYASPFVGRPARRLLSSRVPFQALTLGPAQLISVPAEPSSALGDALRGELAAVFPDSVPFVVAHANDWAGYAVSEAAYRRGGYEACLSFRGPGFGAWIVDAARGTLRSLAATSPE